MAAPDTIPTSQLDDYELPDDEDDTTWGLLYPISAAFSQLQMLADSYVFGKDANCDVTFEKPLAGDQDATKFWQTYSRRQFSVQRDIDSGKLAVTDHSMNGTFLNGAKIGRGKSAPLPHNSEIALSFLTNKAYIFVDLKRSEEEALPDELRRRFRLCDTLGRGACGEVRRAFDKDTGDTWAVKIVEKGKFSLSVSTQRHSAQSQALTEARILRTLTHPAIIHIEEVIETDSCFYMVLELCGGGELYECVEKAGKLDDSVAKFIMIQVFRAVEYLHGRGLTHRDLKPENILLTSREDPLPRVKVTDFGLSKVVDSATQLKTYCGTPTYIAPEVLQTHGLGVYTEKIDCWSLGVILFVCLVGYPPFTEQRDDMLLNQQILEGNTLILPHIWKDVNKSARNLMESLIVVNPLKRFSMTEALTHSWISDDTETLQQVDELFATATRSRDTKLRENLLASPSNPGIKRKLVPNDNAKSVKAVKR